LSRAAPRVDPIRFARFCAANPDDGVCRPQRELTVTPEQVAETYKRPEIAVEVARAGDDHSVPGVRAVFAMAPALVQMLDPASLADYRIPVHIILGDADKVAPPATNGLVAAKLISGAELQQLADVGHYDFVATCTDEGRKVIPICDVKVPQPDTHRLAIAAALDFFRRNLGSHP
jgi:predicted dienelactone hydrolase